MKKVFIAAALISGLTISTGAFASHGMAGGGHMGGHGMAHQQQLDPETQAKVDQFYKDTQDLRRQMVVKQAEKRAMMQRTNPDPAAVGQLTGEIFDLHTTMTEKAKEAGVEQYVGHGMGKKSGMKMCKMMSGDKGMMHGGGKGMMHGGGAGMDHGSGAGMGHGQPGMDHGAGPHGNHPMPTQNQQPSDKI